MYLKIERREPLEDSKPTDERLVNAKRARRELLIDRAANEITAKQLNPLIRRLLREKKRLKKLEQELSREIERGKYDQ